MAEVEENNYDQQAILLLR